MLSFIADLLGAYYIARSIKKKLIAILFCFGVGMASNVLANIAIYAIASEQFSPKEIVLRMIVGSVIHPVITLIAWFFWSRKNRPGQDH
ncbi:MAG: hypothetical protein JNK37_00085 [Verrucomicrobiales bacterium]|nr:hypothetical protein [Verrucomicrobiales bacterium]